MEFICAILVVLHQICELECVVLYTLTCSCQKWINSVMMVQFNFKFEHQMGTKHLNGDSLFQISCDMKEYNFRCEGCKGSSKLRRHKSLEFVKVGDVVPLFTRNTSSSGINTGCTSFHAVRSFLYWWIILVVLLAAIISIITGNFPFERLKFVFTRNVSASRINYGCTRLHAVQSF